jgi:hypothetical protein
MNVLPLEAEANAAAFAAGGSFIRSDVERRRVESGSRLAPHCGQALATTNTRVAAKFTSIGR